MFKIIRCGEGFELVIVKSPADGPIGQPGAHYYRYAVWQIGDHFPGVFNEITEREAWGYFSGHADGLGFEDVPEQIFETLDQVIEFIRKERGK
jgi:hypothetical protein